MPPKTPNDIDGLSKPATPPEVQAPPTANSPVDIEQDSGKELIDANLVPEIKQQVKTSKAKRGPAIPILITLIVMVLLIGLAYFAYNKSK
jgi:hypothetical protein